MNGNTTYILRNAEDLGRVKKGKWVKPLEGRLGVLYFKEKMGKEEVDYYLRKKDSLRVKGQYIKGKILVRTSFWGISGVSIDDYLFTPTSIFPIGKTEYSRGSKKYNKLREDLDPK